MAIQKHCGAAGAALSRDGGLEVDRADVEVETQVGLPWHRVSSPVTRGTGFIRRTTRNPAVGDASLLRAMISDDVLRMSNAWISQGERVFL